MIWNWDSYIHRYVSDIGDHLALSHPCSTLETSGDWAMHPIWCGGRFLRLSYDFYSLRIQWYVLRKGFHALPLWSYSADGMVRPSILRILGGVFIFWDCWYTNYCGCIRWKTLGVRRVMDFCCSRKPWNDTDIFELRCFEVALVYYDSSLVP